MKKIYRQTDEEFIDEIQEYGCLFMSMYYFSPLEYTRPELNVIWMYCVNKGWIKDNYIINHTAVAHALGWKVTYTEEHVAPNKEIPVGCKAIGRFVYNMGHFVCLNEYKDVIYDPLGESLSVKKGKLESLRLYKEDIYG